MVVIIRYVNIRVTQYVFKSKNVQYYNFVKFDLSQYDYMNTMSYYKLYTLHIYKV